MKNKFKENLRELRILEGLDQKALAEKLGVSVKTISHWETGYSEPSINQIILLVEIFKTNFEELLLENK